MIKIHPVQAGNVQIHPLVYGTSPVCLDRDAIYTQYHLKQDLSDGVADSKQAAALTILRRKEWSVLKRQGSYDPDAENMLLE